MSDQDRPEIQGWYRQDNDEELRVRLLLEGRSMQLQTLSGRMVASWSLDHLRNLSVPTLGALWSIGDNRLAGPTLVLENDDDYRMVRNLAPGLVSPRARGWRQLGFAFIESSNQTGLLVLLLAALVAVAGYVLSLF